MALHRGAIRGDRGTRHSSKSGVRRPKRRSLHTSTEALESRCLLAVTNITPVPVTVIEQSSFTGEVVHFTANDAGPFTATIGWGDLTNSPGTIAALPGGGFAVSGTHTYAEDGPYTISVTITDTADATMASGNSSATVREAVLTMSGISASVPENSTALVPLATFTDPGSPDPASEFSATINWGNGVTNAGTITGSNGTYTISGNPPSFTDEGTAQVTVTAFENNDPTFSISITNPVTITEADVFTNGVLTFPSGVVEGQVLPTTTQIATFSDTGFPTNVASDFTATINFGDGTAPVAGTVVALGGGNFAVQGGHTFAEEGNFPISVVVNDNAPGTASITISGTVTILNAPLTASPVTIHGTEGAPLTNVDVATFVDADPLGDADDFVATINWGDGTTTAGIIVQDAQTPSGGGTMFHVEGSHTYTEERSTAYPVTVTIIDRGDADAPITGPLISTATTTSSALIAQAPLLPVANTLVATEGTALPAGTQLATFTDAGGADVIGDYTATVDWGDGSGAHPATVIALGPANFAVVSSGAFTYKEEGAFALTVKVTDSDTTDNPGGVATTAQTTSIVTVRDAALTASSPQPAVNTTESSIFPVPVFGAPLFTGPVASFTDANPAAPVDDFRAIIDWGDGTPLSIGSISQPGGAGTAFQVNGNHTYADSGVNGGTGQFRITVYIADEGGSKLSIFNTANVADNPINVTAFLNPKSDSGQSHFDAITNVAQPSFFGTSEPHSHVMLFATPTGGGPLIMLGQTQAGSDGSWSIKSTNRLADGSYNVTAAAMDQFNKTTSSVTNVLPNAGQGPLVIDTVGPRVTFAFFNRLNGEVDVVFRDERSGMNVATLIDAANYSLTKPHTQPATFLVTSLTPFLTPGNPTAPVPVAVGFNGAAPLRGGFYTFTIRDSSRGPSTVQDVAGNSLDGEFYGTFPSGNGIPGGDFVAMLDAIHNKIFAPQTVVGTANPANGGQGGLPVGAPHSGIFTPVVPRGATPTPVFTATVNSRVTTAMATKPIVQVQSSLTSPSKHPSGPLGHK